MPIDRSILEATARAYVKGMTSIRGRRVHRLNAREFARFDEVVQVKVDGSVAVLETSGRGPAATIARRRLPQGRIATTSYDLLRDSLPPVAAAVSNVQRKRVAEALRCCG